VQMEVERREIETETHLRIMAEKELVSSFSKSAISRQKAATASLHPPRFKL